MFDQKTPGGGFCLKARIGVRSALKRVLAPVVQRFVRGLGFCLTKKPRGFPGGFCLKVGVGVRLRVCLTIRGFLSEGWGWFTEGVSAQGVV